MNVKIRCPKCNEELDMNTEKGFVFCNNCGEKISFGNESAGNSGVQDSGAPAVNGIITESSVNADTSPKKKGHRGMAILSFVFSFTGILSPVAFILGIVALATSFKHKDKKHGFAIAGIVLGIVFSIVAFFVFLFIYGLSSAVIGGTDNTIEKLSSDTKYSKGGISFTIPGEFGGITPSLSSSDHDSYFDSNVAGIITVYLDDAYADSVNLTLDEIYDITIDRFVTVFDGSSRVTDRKLVTRGGVRCKEFNGLVYDDNGKEQMDLSGIIIYNDKTHYLVMVMFVEEQNLNNSYREYYNKLLDSISVSGSSGSYSSSSSSSSSSSYSSGSGKVDPDLKAFLDDYEDFVDDYVRILSDYNSGNYTDYTTMLRDYLAIVEKYSEFEEKMEALDKKSSSFSDADLAYYMDVVSRCSQKMLSAY